MADNRQFADHVEIGGANVYFKEEPTTDTTMANTSYFKTVDADGNPVKISRDNIMGIVKECLGTILNGLSDQTTVTKVPTLNGNTLGASTAATLASVLGDRLNIWHGQLELNQSITLPAKTWKGGLLIKTANTATGLGVDTYTVRYYGAFSETSGSLTIRRSEESGPVTLTATSATTVWVFIGIGD